MTALRYAAYRCGLNSESTLVFVVVDVVLPYFIRFYYSEIEAIKHVSKLY